MSADKPPLLALTLRRPWALAITAFGKRVENRVWAPPKTLVGQWLAIHAGKGFDADHADHIRDHIDSTFPIDPKLHLQGIVAAAKLKLVTTDPDELPADQIDWYVDDSVFWLLDDVVVFDKPVTAAGKQGLWAVTGETLEQCRAQFAKALADGTVLR